MSLFLSLALPSLFMSLLSHCLGSLLCDIHFSPFIMQLMSDRWKLIKGELIIICQPKNVLLILLKGGNDSLKVQTLRSVLSIICAICFISLGKMDCSLLE